MVEKVYPHRENLELSIIKPWKQKNNVVRYKALITRELTDKADMGEMTSLIAGKDGVGITKLRIQLVELGVEPITMLSVGGIFKANSRLDLLHHLISNNVAKVTVNGVKPVDKINIDEMNNNDKVEQLMIPHMIDLLALPRYIQHRAGGCYKGGIGSYIQRYQDSFQWFVYPLYDATRFDKASNKLIIYVVGNLYPTHWENSFLHEGNTTKIVVKAQPVDTNSLSGRHGNKKYGVRIVDEAKVDKGPFQVTETSITGSKRSIYKEIIHKGKPDGLDQIAQPSPTITSNEAMAKEEVIMSAGIRMDFEWTNSQYELLRPGMKIRVYKEVYNNIEVSDGTLLTTHTLRSRAVKGVSDEPMIEHTHLTCFTRHVKTLTF